LTPSAFAATQAVIASLVDGARLTVYGAEYFRGKMGGIETKQQWSLVAVATILAFVGALVGRSLLPKVTLGLLRGITGVMLLIVAVALGLGLI
ncbi:MAG: sulfite exporter TauE/SafE family protein, partial [Gammaproteobacteria bacterium]|nr:sulfite exporter TauE/SafE family protein [Gammaproteobacteria bacterium]